MNTMRVGVTIPTGWPPFSFGSAGSTSSFYDERVWGGGGVGLTYMRIYRLGQPGGGNVCVCGELWTERKRVQTMGASECIVQRWPSILPHLTTCSRTHAHHPSGGRTTPVVVAPPIHPSCVFTDSRVVSLFLSGVVFVWVSLSLALRCSLSLSLCPLPFLRHTHADDLIHRVCMTTSPHHGTAGVWL